MVAFISGILLLFLLLRAIKLFGRMSPALIARWARRGGFFLIFASVAYLIFAGRGGLFRLFSTSLRNSFSPNKFDPLADDFTATGKPAPRRTKVARTEWIEMRLDLDVGGMRGYVHSGPYAGRDLSALTRDEGLKLYDLCRASDPEGARLLETYFDRRFTGWRQAYQGQGQSGGGRAAGGAMSRDEAYEILGLAKGSGAEEIVRAHRSLMKKLHPDHGGSTALAARVNQAKDVLLDRHG